LADVPRPERVLAEALPLARREAAVARALPVALYRTRKRLDFDLLRRMARERGQGRTLGFFLDLSLPGTIYYHHDHLGGVVLETNEHGAVVREASFDPYGGDLQPAADEPYAFTGKERDPHTGLYDFGARVYDPKLGLFLSPDPAPLDDPELAVDDPQLLSIYSYTRNNPTSHIDPDGRLPQIVVGAFVGGLIGAGAYLVKSAHSSNFSWKALGGAAAGGAVSGAIAVATGGTSLFLNGAISGVGGGIAARAIETRSVSETFSPDAMFSDALIGGTSAVVLGYVGAVVGPKIGGVAKAILARSKAARVSAGVAPGTGAGVAAASPAAAGSPRTPFWTATNRRTSAQNAFQHFKDHGADVGAKNSVDYVLKAREFMQNPPPGTLTKVRARNGDVVRYEPSTNTFGVMDSNGSVRTFYKPDPAVHRQPTNMDYFNGQ
jgi:RHS repeat-associated protein